MQLFNSASALLLQWTSTLRCLSEAYYIKDLITFGLSTHIQSVRKFAIETRFCNLRVRPE